MENTGMVAISGTDSLATNGISLTLFESKPGSYPVDGTFTQATYFVGNVMHKGATGTIVITKLENNKISGTFNFVETGGVKVTEGVFKDVLKK